MRESTIGTLLLDGKSGRLEAWAGAAPRDAEPLYSWHLPSFFD